MTMYIMYMYCIHVVTLYPPCLLDDCTHASQVYHTLLHLAARNGHITCVECLLSTHGIDVNSIADG